MARRYFPALFLLYILPAISSALLPAQEQRPPLVPYQIPSTIYIGDRGIFVYPLDVFAARPVDEIIPLETISQNADIVIHRIEIKDGRLLIDFQPFRTGRVPLPAIFVGGALLEGLEVSVATLLGGKEAVVLSPAAVPVNMPGTLWIIIAFAALIIAAAGAACFAALRGGAVIRRLRHSIEKRRALRILLKTVKKTAGQWEKELIPAGALLSAISAGMRQFLDNYCAIDCRPFVPAEFLRISLPKELIPPENYSPRYFADFFTRCDTARFSGSPISKETAAAVISEVEMFAAAIKNYSGQP